MTQNLTGNQRPKPLQVIPENIPEALKEFNQWVLWDYKLRDEKWTKVPLQARNGYPAKVNESGNWEGFENTIEALKKYKVAGIGFVFTKDDPFLGIDLDKVLSPFGNSYRANETAKRFLEELKTYRELSPSETGLHFILKGHLPIGGRRHGSVEMYDCDRYFTFTGNLYKNRRREISEGGEVFKELYREFIGQFNQGNKQNNSRIKESKSSPFSKADSNDSKFHQRFFDDPALIQKIRNSKQGGKFSRLWEGDFSDYGSHSEADLALCSILAFWTDCDQIRLDKLFRQSALMREKWDESRSSEGKTYGQITIEKVVGQSSDHSITENDEEWPDEPEPFFNLKRTLGKYPLEAYPPIIKNAVEAFVNYAQTPISMTASIALGYAASSVQHLALVARDKQTFGPCSLYVLNIAQSGERKSTVDRAFEKGLRGWEKIIHKNTDHHEEELSKDGSPKRIIYEDATAEGLAIELQNNNKSIVLASSEGGSIFGSVGMRGEAILKALSFFNKAWDADTQSMSRKQSESVYLSNYRVSLNIAVQFESLDYWLEKHIGLAKGIGFLGRFLVNIPDSNIGQRFYRKAPRNVHELNAFQEACVFSLGQSSDLEQPRIIDFTQEAESEWIKYFDETEEAQKVGGRWEQNKASASKSPEQAARIAAVFTLIENPGSTEIPGSVMSNAIKVTRYHLNESLRLEGQTGATLIERDAQILLKWLADQDLSSGWSTSRIKQYGPNSIRKPDRCDAALKLLEIYGYLKIINKERKVKIRFHPKFPECIKRENQYSNSR